MPRPTMTIEEARAWLKANKDRFRKYDNIEDMPPEIRESRLLGPDSDVSWQRLLRELRENAQKEEDDDDGAD